MVEELTSVASRLPYRKHHFPSPALGLINQSGEGRSGKGLASEVVMLFCS